MLKFFFQGWKHAHNQVNKDGSPEKYFLKAYFHKLYLDNFYLTYYKFC